MSLVVESGLLGRRIRQITEAQVAAGRASGAIRHVLGNLFSRTNLLAVSVSNTTGRVGVPFNSVVSGFLSGSTLSISPATPLPAGVTFTPATRTFGGSPSVSGSFPVTIIETNASAGQSPASTSVGPFVIAVAFSAPAAPPAAPKPATQVKKADK